jgi:hypothetical protein
MKHAFLLLLLLPGAIAVGAEPGRPEAGLQQKFISGGSIRMQLETGGYTISATDSENIVVTCHANSSDRLNRVKVEIRPAASSADVYISNTPNNNFNAIIEVPRHSNLWVRLSAGELKIEDIEGDKNVELMAGQLEIEIPHPETYGHRDASVTTGSIDASAFDVSKGGLFRSFEQQGPGRYRLHAHVMAGEIDLTSTE